MTTGSENADNLSRITVLAFDENQYVVQMQDNDEPDERMLARVITTELEDVLLASASALGTDEVDSGWLIFRVQLDRDRLLVSEMEEGHYKKLEDVRSTKEVRDYVVGHIHELDFFDDPAVFVRVTDE